MCLYATDFTSPIASLVSPIFTPEKAPNYEYLSTTAGTDTVIGRDFQAAGFALNKDMLLDGAQWGYNLNHIRDATKTRTDSFVTLGTFNGVTLIRTYVSGSMVPDALRVNNTHFSGETACQALGRCISPQVVGTLCGSTNSGAPAQGICYEAADGQVACGKAVEVFGHFSSVNTDGSTGTAVNVDTGSSGTPYACARGTATGATGSISIGKRVPIVGCMIAGDANYHDFAELHEPQFCAVPAAYKPGCLFAGALNFNPGAKQSTRCFYKTSGCTIAGSLNYNAEATDNDGSCIARIEGCTLGPSIYSKVKPTTPAFQSIYADNAARFMPREIMPLHKAATNYRADANVNEGCIVAIEGCLDSSAANYDPKATVDSNTWCVPSLPGCMDPHALTFSLSYTVSTPTACKYRQGCMDAAAINYDQRADLEGECYYATVSGCLDLTAQNYGCKFFSTDPCGAAQKVTVHWQDVCVYAGEASEVVAADVTSLLGNTGAEASDKVEIIQTFTVNKEPCDVTTDETSAISAAVKTSLSLGEEVSVSTVVVNCFDRRRLQNAAAGPQAQLTTSIVVPLDDAAAVESTVETSGIFTSKEAMNTMLSTATLPDGTPLSNTVQVTSNPVKSVKYYRAASQKKTELSAGAVVGIVIGVLCVVILVVAGGIMMKKRQSKTLSVVPA